MTAYLVDLDSLLDPFIRFLTQGYVPWSLSPNFLLDVVRLALLLRDAPRTSS
jgi:hypothetical protein